MTLGRRLVINADDFGLSPGVNRGIVEGHQAGSITSTSLLVNLPAFQDAVRCARQVPRLGIGLHFNLTAGPPVSGATAVPSLADPETGRFRPLAQLVARALTGRIVASEVAAECTAQLTRCRANGVSPTHLDSHRHVHLLPGVWESVVAVAQRERISVVRKPFDRLGHLARTPSAFAEQVLLRASHRLAAGNGKLDRFAPLIDHFRGGDLFGQRDFRDRLLAVLDTLDPGLTELMVHPGYGDSEAAEWDSYVGAREDELHGLTDAAVRARLSAGDIELVDFGALAAGTNA